MGLKIGSAWGIEIGSNSFNAVQLKKAKGEIAITNSHVFTYPKPIENEDEEFVDFAKQGLMSLFGEGVIKKNDSVFVSIPGRHIFSRPIELPPMDMRKFHELIKYEASQQIPHSLDEVVWDYHLDHSEDNVNAILFAAHRDQINRIITVFKEAHLQIIGIQSSTLAILNYMRHDNDFDKSSVVIDIKSKNIDFVVNDGLRFWQRNIARGGDDFNKALMTKFKIPFAQAEELKRSMSQGGPQAEKIQKVITPVFKSMANEVQRSIGHYCNQHEETKIEDIFMLGNAYRMTTLIAYFKKNLRLNIHVLNKLGRLAEHAQVDIESFNEKHGDFVVPLGLALQGIGEASLNVNLLPPEIIEQQVAKKRAKWLVISALMFLAAGGFHFSKLYTAQESINIVKTKTPSRIDKHLKNVAQHIKKESTKVAPANKKLQVWLRNLRDRETYYKRDAWVTAIDQINKTLYKADAGKQDIIYIKEIIIEKTVPVTVDPLKKAINDQIPKTPKAAAEKVFKVSIEGSFFARSETNKQINVEYIRDKITNPLNDNKDYFQNMEMSHYDVEDHKELNVPVCKYTIEGYFVPEKQ